MKISKDHALIQLGNFLDWPQMVAIVLPDLQNTAKKQWWRGRKLFVRIHLGVYLLQTLLKTSDRRTEELIKMSPVYQVFCGRSLIPFWRCPDATKIEEFRNRLSPETRAFLAASLVKHASSQGLADPSQIDLDSTVQEANMAYPSDANLLQSLANRIDKVIKATKNQGKLWFKDISFNLKTLKKKCQEYFFLGSKVKHEQKCKVFKTLYRAVSRAVIPVLQIIVKKSKKQFQDFKWNIQRDFEILKNQGFQYLSEVRYFIKHHTPKPGKTLSFHAKDVTCIKKGKVGKPFEFGRVFQIMRTGGNLLIPVLSQDVKMHDKTSLVPAIQMHQYVFGKTALKSIATDKGYYSSKNIALEFHPAAFNALAQ